ncbi:hypothetical protein PCL1606_04520 [Pseudomonas chlororaphis]|uniref:Uncharacterized protein n=1 Tax=Pseudomonas chlororaphis TaxID=587753 RepID=A0A0D5XT46_9PSED|nr:hypothetical protein PCL1606_04520 [Pseudomonas chlororaphis]
MPTNAVAPGPAILAVFSRSRGTKSAEKSCKRPHRHWMRPCLYWIRRTL